MADSELPKDVVAITVVHPQGNREMLKDKKGKFVKKPKKIPTDTKEIKTYLRKFLTSPIANADGTIDKEAKSHLAHIIDNMVSIATRDSSGVCVGVTKKGDPIYGPDAKSAMASVKAAEFLFQYSVGKPSPSDEEMDAFKHSGIKTIVIPFPTGMPHPDVIDGDQPRKQLKPNFIDAVVVSTNKDSDEEATDKKEGNS